MRIFSKEDSRFKEMTPRPFRDEAELQLLIERHSNLIPVDLDPRRKAIREFQTASGGIDHVVIDASGSVLILETKLASNTTRREVIAQAIDYAAQLTKFGPQAFLDRAREKAGNDFTEDWFETETEREDFLRSLETNLRLGQLSLLIVMDHAESRLKDAVRFVNRATHFSCLIAEVTVFEVGDRELVAVDLYGQETVDEKSSVDGGGASKMDRATFLATKAKNGMAEEAKAFLEALDLIEADGATVNSTAAGFYFQGRPLLANHYLMWHAGAEKMVVWAPGAPYDSVKRHLEVAPAGWQARIVTKPLKPGGQYGKVAEIEGARVTEAEVFLELFRHYLSAPTTPA